MSSLETQLLLKKVSDLSYRLKCLPYYLRVDASHKSEFIYGPRLHRLLWFTSTVLHILVKLVLIVLVGIWYDLTHDCDMTARTQYYFLLSLECMSLTLQMFSLLFPDRILSLFNTYCIFETKIRAIHRLDLVE